MLHIKLLGKENNKWSRLRKWMSTYSSRQIRKKIIREDTALTCVRTSLWRKGKRIGNNVEIIENNDVLTSLEIHSLRELKIVDYLYKMKLKKLI